MGKGRQRSRKGRCSEKYIYVTSSGKFVVNMTNLGKRCSKSLGSLEDALNVRARYVRELEASGIDVPELRRSSFVRWSDCRRDRRRKYDPEVDARVEREVWEDIWRGVI